MTRAQRIEQVAEDYESGAPTPTPQMATLSRALSAVQADRARLEVENAALKMALDVALYLCRHYEDKLLAPRLAQQKVAD